MADWRIINGWRYLVPVDRCGVSTCDVRRPLHDLPVFKGGYFGWLTVCPDHERSLLNSPGAYVPVP